MIDDVFRIFANLIDNKIDHLLEITVSVLRLVMITKAIPFIFLETVVYAERPKVIIKSHSSTDAQRYNFLA